MRTRRRVFLFCGTESTFDHELATAVGRYGHGEGRWDMEMSPPALVSMGIMSHFRPDGIIARTSFPPAMARWVQRRRIPVIYTGWVSDPLPPNAVVVDLRAIVRQGAAHLVEQGLRRLLLVQDVSPPVMQTVQHAAFTSCCRELGVEGHAFRFPPLTPKQWSLKRRIAQVRTFLRQFTPPMGVILTQDHLWDRLYTACAQLGWHVPEDLAVVSSGLNVVRCILATPPLSSAVVDVQRVGAETARRLDRWMEEGSAPTAPVLIPPLGLEMRGSSETIVVADRSVASALHLIRRHALGEIDVNDVARHAHLSRRTLERRFKKLLGRSPALEIRRVRIGHARRLLVQGNEKISTIARHCGFPNLREFWRVFRRVTGQCPSQYRRAQRMGQRGVSS